MNDFVDYIENPDEIDIHEVDEIIPNIKKFKISEKDDQKKLSDQKIIISLYKHAIPFIKMNKFKTEILFSNKLLSNITSIVNNKIVVHHSHVSGKIFGYAHNFCNQKVKENYYTIPVFAHNQFRFDFFILLKGLRSTENSRNSQWWQKFF